MKKSIDISAVIPTYNREQIIARAIDSVLSQEFPVSEIIVVDDGSQDDTRKIIESYGEKVRYVYQENAGVAVARNRGVREAKHEWIAFLDSDDSWLPDHLRRITEVILATEEKAALYFSDTKRPADEGGGSYWDLCSFSILGSYEFRQVASDWAMMQRQPMILQASVIRRESYVEIGGLPPTLRTREDTFLFHLLCLLFPACAVAGFGAAMSSDGDKSVRLTNALPTSAYFECSKLLYKELLLYSGKMTYDHRKEIKKRLVLAHLNFGCVLLQRKRIFSAIANFLGAVSMSPKLSIGLAAQMLRAYCDKRFLIYERSGEKHVE